MSNQQLAQQILAHIGGAENVESATNCMTRLRIVPNDVQKVNQKAIKGLAGVMGVVEAEGQLQIILGPGKVIKVTEEFKKLVSATNKAFGSNAVAAKKAALKEKNNTPMKNVLKKLGNIFIPLIPLFIACGLLLAINNILGVQFGDEWKASNFGKIVALLGGGVFGTTLSILVGVNASKEFGSNMPMIGGVLGAILSAPALADITLFGNQLLPGRGGVFSVILVVVLAVFVEKGLRKVVPDALDLFITPIVTLTVAVLAALIVLQPVGGFISDGIGTIVAGTISSDNIIVSTISGAISAALFLPLVMTGLHHGLIPIHTELINSVGFTVLLPILATAGMAQVGAVIAVWSRTKNKQLKTTIKSGIIPGVLGIGEPLIYGVTLPLGKPFMAACAGAAVGGAVMAIFKVGSVALGVSGLPLALLIADGKMIVFLAGVTASYFAGYAFTNIVGFDDPVEEDETYEANVA